MAIITKGYSFGATETVTSAKLSALVDNATVSNISSSDISSSAITDIKINDVSGAKLTTLSSTPSGAGQFPVANIAYTGITTDVNSVAWTEYSSVSTITGWSSFTQKGIYYKKIGKLVFVYFHLAGVSNSTSVSFTLPYTSYDTSLSGGVYGATLIDASDNSAELTVASKVQLPVNSSTATCYTNMGSGAWTNSGGKTAIGQFWYEVTT